MGFFKSLFSFMFQANQYETGCMSFYHRREHPESVLGHHLVNGPWG